eukprot:7624276-Pyramimonas_sp.AAC.1
MRVRGKLQWGSDPNNDRLSTSTLMVHPDAPAPEELEAVAEKARASSVQNTVTPLPARPHGNTPSHSTT